MYLKSLQISDMQCFRRAEASFQYPGRSPTPSPRYPNVNLLLGNNGMGKSATLKAVALAILSPIIPSAGYVPYSIVRHSRRQPSAEIRGDLLLHPQDLDGAHSPGDAVDLKTVIERKGTTERIVQQTGENPQWEKMFDDGSPAFLLVGYGATRTVESPERLDVSARRKSRLLRYERVAGLFEEHVPLMPLGAWLPEMGLPGNGDRDRHEEIVDLVNRLLPKGTGFKGDFFSKGEYWFYHRLRRVPFRALSDGYRAYIGWVCDLLFHLCAGCPSGTKLSDQRGIVLIDEIDLHLHPEWQLSVLPTISRALPNLQFICTTHSPMVAGTVESANTLLLMPDGKRASRLEPPEAEIHGLNADQILLSPHFGLTSSRAPDFVDELRKASRTARGGDRDAARQFMRMVSLGAAADDARERKRPEWITRAAEKRQL